MKSLRKLPRKLYDKTAKYVKIKFPVLFLVYSLNKNYSPEPLIEPIYQSYLPQVQILTSVRGGNSNFNLQPTSCKTRFFCRLVTQQRMVRAKLFFMMLYYKKMSCYGFIYKQVTNSAHLYSIINGIRFNRVIDIYYNNIAESKQYMSQEHEFFDQEFSENFSNENKKKSDSILSKSNKKKGNQRSNSRTRKIGKKMQEQNCISFSQVFKLYEESRNKHYYDGTLDDFVNLITDPKTGFISNSSLDEGRFAVYVRSMNYTTCTLRYPSFAQFPEFSKKYFLNSSEFLDGDVLFRNSSSPDTYNWTMGEIKTYRPPNFMRGNDDNLTTAILKHGIKIVQQQEKYLNSDYIKSVILGVNTEHLSYYEAREYARIFRNLPISDKTWIIMANLTAFLPYTVNQ